MRRSTLLFVSVLALAHFSCGYKPHDFRLCRDASFCQRQHAYAGVVDNSNNDADHRFSIASPVTLSAHGDSVSAQLRHPRQIATSNFVLTIVGHRDGIFNLKIQEESEKSIHSRYIVTDSLINPEKIPLVISEVNERGYVDISAANSNESILRLFLSPFSAELIFNGKEAIALNTRGYLRYERYRQRGEADGLDEGIPQDNLWEESFRNFRDNKPYGPSSVGMDITHLGAKHIYGIPQRATSYSLPDSIGKEPYRLYNLDVFEYDVYHSYQPLYGAVPLLLGHNADLHSAVLWLNPSETFIDIATVEKGKHTHWFSEAGIIDVYVFASKTPKQVQTMYASLTGAVHMPPLFAIAYHQCRWNYNDEADVRAVDAAFDEHDIPYDVIWLDIEHTEGKKYFTWDARKFPNSVKMIEDIASRGRKMVTIIDPHLKIDGSYGVYQEAKNLGLFVKNRDGGDYEGHCWPGGSMWLDYIAPHVREYWASRFQLDKYVGATRNLYTWNDMNEPSVFNGPEITMPKDNVHFNGVEHREIHNIYGFLMTWATYLGQKKVREGERTFILTRSFFPGSQRHAAVWTGDNEASWDSLRITSPMLLSLSSAGIQFAGADIGGFFKNPDQELLVRWYQMAAFQPFMRAHAHIETERREPWLFGPEITAKIRSAIRTRYILLPYLYTLFYQAHSTGVPVMRPMFFEFPQDEELFAVDDQFMLGEALVIKPSTSYSQTKTSLLLPSDDTVWYNYFTGLKIDGKRPTLDTPSDQIAVLQRGGTIVAQRRRARRNSAAMSRDPLTLQISLDKNGYSQGFVYLDDGISELSTKCSYRHYVFSNSILTGVKSQASPCNHFESEISIERIVIFGLEKPPNKVAQGETVLSYTFDSISNILTIKKPSVVFSSNFEIKLEHS